MKRTTLCFLIKNDQVLLAMKKRGFGVGKWNGVGGKLKENETAEEAAIREIKEEIGVDITLKDLKRAGTLKFDYDGNPDWEQECQVFIIENWTGEPTESEEMRPQWYPKDGLPFSEMWIDDPHWLPKVLADQALDGEFLFDKMGGTMLNCKVQIR